MPGLIRSGSTTRYRLLIGLQTLVLVASLFAPLPAAAGDPPPDPTPAPSVEPSVEPSAEPSVEPSVEPTPEPTSEPTPDPTPDPTATPDPTPDPTPEESTPPDPTPPPLSGDTVSFIVTFSGGDSAAQADALSAVGAVETSSVPALNMRVVDLPAETFLAGLDTLRASPIVAAVDIDRTRSVGAAPNDTAYAEQWALPQIGWDQLYGTTTPAGNAVVAVLDTGVDGGHPDLDGVVVPGISILDGSNGLTDANGHGTGMASIVGGEVDNWWGVAGVAYDGVSIMPVTVLDASGQGQDSDVIAGVVYAADHGADVILMAFSNPGFSPALQAAIDYAWAARRRPGRGRGQRQLRQCHLSRRRSRGHRCRRHRPDRCARRLLQLRRSRLYGRPGRRHPGQRPR